jgi:pyruvate,orthophosphate dikinase
LDTNAKTLTSVPKDPNQQPLQIKEGDSITIDGSSGLVFLGEMPTVSSGQDENFEVVMHWADKYKRLRVLANAETHKDVNKARDLGAEGVGLCRSEHMFFLPDRIDIFRQMILSDSKEEREFHLEKLLPLQQKDFFDLFEAMHGNQVTVRLLDPP